MTSTFATTTCAQDKGRLNGISLNQKQYQKFPGESAGASLPPSPAVSTPIHSKSPASNGYPFDYSDPCTSIAQLFGVKVRDFAFEAHRAKTARVVTMEDSLKYQYFKYRATHQAPPEDLINDLSYYEGEWLEDAEKKPDDWFVVEDSDY